jgi:acetyl-CoA synthetase
MSEKIWTPQEIAEHFKVQDRAVRRWINEGKLEAFKIGGFWRVKDESLQAFIESSTSTETNKEG